MTTILHRRVAALRLALAVLLLAGGAFLSPLLMQSAYAQQESTCSATCARGSCTGKGNCTCSCSIFWGLPMCTCSSQPETDPGNG
jgi:hypothetical protein